MVEAAPLNQLTNVIRVLPPTPGLKIMVLHDQPQEGIFQMLTFQVRKSVDLLDVDPNTENALPPGHRVRSHQRMDGGQVSADVLRGAPRALEKLDSQSLSRLDVLGLAAGHGQRL